MAESEEELKILLMIVRKKSGKDGLKLNIQKTKIMAPSSITSWQIDGEKVEAVTDFIFLGWKFTVQSDLRHEIKRHLILVRKAMTDLHSVLKSRDITLLTKVHIVHIVIAVVFPVVMYGWESWTMKDELWRTDTLELWCWKRFLRIPWTARRSNQSIQKEIILEYSLEGLVLKLQYFCHHMWRTDSLEKTLMLGKTEGRRRGQQRMRWHHRLNGHEFEELWETVKDQESWHAAVPRVAKSWIWLGDWTTQQQG